MEQQPVISAALQRQNIRSYVQEVRSRIGTSLSSLNAQQLQEIVGIPPATTTVMPTTAGSDATAASKTVIGLLLALAFIKTIF